MIVDIAYLIDLHMQLKAINEVPLEEIEWTCGNIPMSFDSNKLEIFKYTGLNNADFILTGYYQWKEGDDDLL